MDESGSILIRWSEKTKKLMLDGNLSNLKQETNQIRELKEIESKYFLKFYFCAFEIHMTT